MLACQDGFFLLLPLSVTATIDSQDCGKRQGSLAHYESTELGIQLSALHLRCLSTFDSNEGNYQTATQ